MWDNNPWEFRIHLYMPGRARASGGSILSLVVAILMGGVRPAMTSTLSPLTARGYTVLPIPQKVVLAKQDFALSDAWHIVLQGGVKSDDVAVESLKRGLNERAHLSLSDGSPTGSGAGLIRLQIASKSVAVDRATG